MLLLDVLLVVLNDKLAEANGGAIAAIVIVGAINILNVLVIARQPESKKKLSFKVAGFLCLCCISLLRFVYFF